MSRTPFTKTCHFEVMLLCPYRGRHSGRWHPTLVDSARALVVEIRLRAPIKAPAT